MKVVVITAVAVSLLFAACRERVRVEVPPPPSKTDYQLCVERISEQYVPGTVRDGRIRFYCGVPGESK